jgi:predicted dehydrogenase
MSIDRRSFIRSAGTAAAVMTAASYSRIYGANERVGVAVIGVNGRGKSHISAVAKHAGAEVRALVDIDQSVSERAAALVVKEQGGEKPKEYSDMRKMFESKDIDAVSIATPNYWHALATIWACQAGKDVYVEKPACHNIFEGRKMIEAARKYQRIVQVGQQSRSTPHKIEAIEHLRSGLIGEVYMAKGLCFKRRKDIGSKEVSAVPPGVDYDMWLGPAQPRPFKENRFHYNWHWYWDFGNGDIGNQGVHQMDVARWGLGVNQLPDNAFSAGGKFVYDDDQETPNTQHCTFDLGARQLQFEVRGLITGGECNLLQDSGGGAHTIGVIFFGSEGYLTTANQGYWSYLGEDRKPGPSGKAGEDDTYLHFDNFLKAVKSRDHEDLNCDIEVGFLSASLCHLANISYRVGDKIRFDPKDEKIIGNAAAQRLISRNYRAPYVVPEKV